MYGAAKTMIGVIGMTAAMWGILDIMFAVEFIAAAPDIKDGTQPEGVFFKNRNRVPNSLADWWFRGLQSRAWPIGSPSEGTPEGLRYVSTIFYVNAGIDIVRAALEILFAVVALAMLCKDKIKRSLTGLRICAVLLVLSEASRVLAIAAEVGQDNRVWQVILPLSIENAGFWFYLMIGSAAAYLFVMLLTCVIDTSKEEEAILPIRVANSTTSTAPAYVAAPQAYTPPPQGAPAPGAFYATLPQTGRTVYIHQ